MTTPTLRDRPVTRLDALPDGKATRAPIVAAVVDAWTRYPPQEVGAVWLLRAVVR